MATHSYMIGVIVLLSVMGFVTRALPFVLGKQMQKSELVLFLGKRLPISVIFLLCIYYVIAIAQPTHWHNLPWQIIALAATLLVHWRWRSIIVSLFIGTAIYLLLDYFL